MLIMFDFKCSSCDTQFEDLVKRGERTIACKHCGAEAHKVITPVRFECGKGIDPGFPTAYDKWAKKRSNPKKWGQVSGGDHNKQW